MSVGSSIDFQSPLKQEPPTFARRWATSASAHRRVWVTALYNWSWSSIRGWPIHSRTRDYLSSRPSLLPLPVTGSFTAVPAPKNFANETSDTDTPPPTLAVMLLRVTWDGSSPPSLDSSETPPDVLALN